MTQNKEKILGGILIFLAILHLAFNISFGLWPFILSVSYLALGIGLFLNQETILVLAFIGYAVMPLQNLVYYMRHFHYMLYRLDVIALSLLLILLCVGYFMKIVQRRKIDLPLSIISVICILINLFGILRDLLFIGVDNRILYNRSLTIITLLFLLICLIISPKKEQDQDGKYTGHMYGNNNNPNYNNFNGQNYNNPNGQNYNNPNGQNYNNPNGQPYNNPYGQNYNNPNGQPYNNPNGQNYNNPNGQSYNNPYGQPYNDPYGQNYNNPNRQSYNNPYGQNYNNPNGQPYNNPNGQPYYNQNGRPYDNYNGQMYNDPNSQMYRNQNEPSNVTGGMKALCFIIPIVGVVLYCSKIATNPTIAKIYLKFAGYGFLVNIVLTIVFRTMI